MSYSVDTFHMGAKYSFRDPCVLLMVKTNKSFTALISTCLCLMSVMCDIVARVMVKVQRVDYEFFLFLQKYHHIFIMPLLQQ